MQKKKSLALNILFMLALLGATLYIIFKDQDLSELWQLLQTASVSMMFMAMFCAVMYLILQSISLVVILKSLGEKLKVLPSLRYSFIGFLFNAITPSASGGQPMMVLYMKEDGINMGASSVAMLFWTIIYKVALVIFETFVLLFYHPFFVDTIGNYRWLFWVGMAVNIISIFLYGIIVFSENGAQYIVRVAMWLLHKLHIVKRRKRIEKKLDTLLASYKDGADYIRSHWSTAGTVLLITLCQRIFYFMIAWFVYRALGLSGSTFIEVIILQSLISVCIDILPVPGGVGANEGFCVLLFRKIMEKRYVNPAMLLSRGVSFYGLLIMSAVITIGTHLSLIFRDKKSGNK
ncbi:MAG: flippase-like domain-containing protein [Lachnospiraceae bacterium]|nr:flippase-like domain-containing protein [Lachnospiraceae bacterium]